MQNDLAYAWDLADAASYAATKTKRKPKTTWINVNKHVIAGNAKHGRNDPPVRVAKGKHGKPVYAHEIEITGPARVVYDAAHPILPCGARLAICTESEVKIIK